MDNGIKEIQDLWNEKNVEPINVDQLINQLNRIDKGTKFRKTFISLVILFVTYMVLTRVSYTIYNVTALILIVTGLLFLTIPLYRNRFKLIETNGSLNNLDCIKNNIKKLQRRTLIPKLYALIFIVLFTLALNIAFYGAFRYHAFEYQLIAHFSTGIIFLLLYYLRNIGIKNHQKHLLPLIENLERTIKN